MNRECGWDRGDEESRPIRLQNFGEEISWKTSALKTEKNMGECNEDGSQVVRWEMDGKQLRICSISGFGIRGSVTIVTVGMKGCYC